MIVAAHLIPLWLNAALGLVMLGCVAGIALTAPLSWLFSVLIPATTIDRAVVVVVFCSDTSDNHPTSRLPVAQIRVKESVRLYAGCWIWWRHADNRPDRLLS
jgi:hypothetical protein